MKLERWETPFTDSRDPSVGILVEEDVEGFDAITLVVAPGGLDGYPKYLVRFDPVVAFTCREEAFSPPISELEQAEVTDRSACAHVWSGSPWVAAYGKGGPLVPAAGDPELRHYVRVRRGQHRRGRVECGARG